MSLTMEQLRAENERLQKEIERMNQDCVERCWFAEQQEENAKLREELKELKAENKALNKELEYEADTSFTELNEEIEELKEEMKSMRKHRDTLLEESEESFMKIHKLEEEMKSLKKSNAQKTKVIHKVRKELKETHDELVVEKNDIQEEFDRYRFDYFFAEECSFCKIPLVYDDYQLSLEVGKWCCEGCYDENEFERTEIH